MEELVEQKRAELSAKPNLTPVTLETFVKWKKRKLREKAEKAKKDSDSKKDKAKAGNTLGLSGKEVFSFNPSIAGEEEDDDEEGEAVDMKQRETDEDDGVKVHEIKFDDYGIMDDGMDESTDAQLAKLKSAEAVSSLNGAAGASGPIDEDLFDDEDLDELEEDLEKLEV